MEREVGGGIGMGNTCKPMAVSFQCMTKSTTKKKKKKKPHSWSFCHLFISAPLLVLLISDVCVCSHFSHVRPFATLWIVTHQAPLSMRFSRQEYSSRLPCPPLGDLPDPGVKPRSLMSPALAGRFFTTSATWEAPLSQKVASDALN